MYVPSACCVIAASSAPAIRAVGVAATWTPSLRTHVRPFRSKREAAVDVVVERSALYVPGRPPAVAWVWQNESAPPSPPPTVHGVETNAMRPAAGVTVTG